MYRTGTCPQARASTFATTMPQIESADANKREGGDRKEAGLEHIFRIPLTPGLGFVV